MNQGEHKYKQKWREEAARLYPNHDTDNIDFYQAKAYLEGRRDAQDEFDEMIKVLGEKSPIYKKGIMA